MDCTRRSRLVANLIGERKLKYEKAINFAKEYVCNNKGQFADVLFHL